MEAFGLSVHSGWSNLGRGGMIQQWIGFIGLMCVASLCLAEVYECQTPDGKRFYSDRACGDKAGGRYEAQKPIYHWQLGPPSQAEKKLLMDADSSKQAIKKRSYREKSRSPCKSFTATQLRNLRVKDKLAKGMPKQHLKKRFGQPDAVEVSGNKEKWYYNKARVKRKLVFKRDCLFAWKENLRNKSKISKYNE